MPRAQSLFPPATPCYSGPVCTINSRPDVCHPLPLSRPPSSLPHPSILPTARPPRQPLMRTDWCWWWWCGGTHLIFLSCAVHVSPRASPTHLGYSSEWIKNSSCCSEGWWGGSVLPGSTAGGRCRALYESSVRTCGTQRSTPSLQSGWLLFLFL